MKKILLSLALILGIVVLPISEVKATVSNNISKVIFAGDGSSTSIPFTSGSYSIPVYLQTDIQVYTDNTANGTITQLTLNNQYSVSLTPATYTLSNSVVYYTAVINLSGGSNPIGAIPVGTNLIINRSIPYTNLINITNYSATPATTWNQGYDRATMLAQQLYTLTQQSILQPVSAITPLTIPSPSANEILCWDPTGTFISNCVNNGSGAPIAVPIANSQLQTLTQAGLVNGSSISGTIPTFNTSGNVGIGTSSMVGRLIVSGGNVGIGTGVPTSLLEVEGGNVGIGTHVSGNSLDVVGTVQATSFTGQNGKGVLASSWNVVSIGTTVQAASDLIINVCAQPSASSAQLYIYENPTTFTCGSGGTLYGAVSNAVSAVACSSAPISKGNYYCVYPNSGSNFAVETAYSKSLGS